jgi:VanZ family protein
MTVADERQEPGSRASVRLRRWGPVVAYCLLIFALSSTSALPSLPSSVSDKDAHVLLYVGLGVLVARAVSSGRGTLTWGGFAATVVFAALYGLSDETHQLFVPGRQFDLWDAAADIVGGALGGGAFWLWGILSRIRHGA